MPLTYYSAFTKMEQYNTLFLKYALHLWYSLMTISIRLFQHIPSVALTCRRKRKTIHNKHTTHKKGREKGERVSKCLRDWTSNHIHGSFLEIRNKTKSLLVYGHISLSLPLQDDGRLRPCFHPEELQSDKQDSPFSPHLGVEQQP